MSFGSEQVYTITRVLSDPGADNKQYHLWRAPAACEVKRAYIVSRDAQGAGSAGEFTLQNWGTAGTAIKSSGGTVVATLGGTASAARLAAGTPKAGTLVEGTLAAGEWLVLDYQETGDWVESAVVIQFDVVYGVGA
jgi:hypothetical protein